MKYKNSLNEFKKTIFVLLTSLNFYKNKSYFILILILFSFTSEQFEISLLINGPGIKSFINDGFYLNPTEVIVNGERRYSCQKSCDF